MRVYLSMLNGEVVMNTNGDTNNVHTQDNRGGSSYIFSQKSIMGVVEESFLGSKTGKVLKRKFLHFLTGKIIAFARSHIESGFSNKCV